jgi:hypothetical protein
MKYNIAPEIITDTPPIIMGIPKEIPTLTRIQPVIDTRPPTMANRYIKTIWVRYVYVHLTAP